MPEVYLTRGTGIEGNTITVDASTLTTGISINSRYMTDSNYNLSMAGGSGDDILRFESLGSDTIDMGDGNDRLSSYNIVNITADDLLLGGLGSDEFRIWGNATLTYDSRSDTHMQGIERMRGNNGTTATFNLTLDDSWFETAGYTTNTLVFESTVRTHYVIDASYITNATYSVRIQEGDGRNQDDVFLGGAGDDRFQGIGTGDDSINLGAGDDVVSFYNGNITASDYLIEGGTGNADILQFLGNAGAIDLNLQDRTMVSGFEIMQLNGDVAHILTINDDYFDRGTEVEGNTLTITSNNTTAGITVDGRAISDSTHELSVTGGDADDTIYGGAGADTINGNDGEDILYGLGGDDSIIATGGSSDSIYGGDGDDRIDARTGIDLVYGQDGNDTITDVGGGASRDSIYGGDGDDDLSAGAAPDAVYGENGADIVRGQSGDDTVVGGYGADILWGGESASPGDGTNAFLYNDPNESTTTETDIIKDLDDDGADADKLLFYGFDTLVTTVPGAQNELRWQNAVGDLTGNGEDDILLTGANNFRLILEGAGAGADNITLAAGDGNNVLFNADATDYLDDGDETNNSAAISGSYITGTSGDDSGGSALSGTVNDDYIIGLEGNDHIEADQAGTDTLYGGAGNDTLEGRNGNDLFFGGAGNDDLRAHDSGPDTMYGGEGDDNLRGNHGADLLYGDAGNDSIDGGSDGDEIWGGSGDDSITGGTGTDTLTGDGGADTFYYTVITHSGLVSGSTQDIITDFSQGQGDQIDLSGIDAFTFAGEITPAQSGDPFAAANSVRFYQDGGNNRTIIQIEDDTTLGTVEMEIELTGLYTLTAGDFVF